MRTILFSLVIIVMAKFAFAQDQKSFYDFRVLDIDSTPYDLSSLKGKKVLVVNVASKCGNTPQYKQLEALYEKYGGDKFTIIAFPANNFFHQEPGSNAEIKEFCTTNYGVTFPVMSKISVKGDDMDPLYGWLTRKSENGVMDASVKWNFQKFMIDEEGRLVDSVSPRIKPDCDKIINWIEGKNKPAVK
jgi:glutathione peroxidase